jgi:hypothetical protein
LDSIGWRIAMSFLGQKVQQSKPPDKGSFPLDRSGMQNVRSSMFSTNDVFVLSQTESPIASFNLLRLLFS